MLRHLDLGRRPTAAILASALGLAGAFIAEAGDWPQFRGPERNGTSPETGLARAWPESGPPELWRVPLGPGFSGIAAVDGKLYTLFSTAPPTPPEPLADTRDGQENDPGGVEATPEDAPEAAGGREVVAAFDAATGRELWRTDLGEAFTNEYGDGPRSTPTVDGDLLYAVSARGKVVALKLADGSEVWSLDLPERFSARVPYWGFATSPALAGDLIVIEAGGPDDQGFAALNKATGETRWTWGDGGRGYGYNTPLVLPGEDGPEILLVTSDRLLALNGAGEERWSHPWTEADTLVMPLFAPPAMVMVSASNSGAKAVRVPRGEVAEPSELWTSRKMKNHFSASVAHDGTVFGFDNAILRTADLATGEAGWARRGFGKGSLITADGLLFVLSDRGRLAVAEASAEDFQETGSVQALEGKSWTAPTLADGVLYLRGLEEMVAYDLRKP